MNESQIFANALKLATAAERAAYLDEACAGDTRLRAAVESLLQAHDSDPAFLETPIRMSPPSPLGKRVEGEGLFESTVAPADLPDAQQSTVVLAGKYRLLEAIGEGGMGTVWMAQQVEPVRRLVAVKLIKVGMDSRQVLARFEAERQALALMDHPNIAKVLDGGAAPDGSPYFVMELVKGAPITRYCDENRLTPRQRVELFVDVCQAVQHAHQKGVIHRDLKPSNVLVARYDDRPVVKVIDFGLAKATGQKLTERTLHTGFGAVVGTLEYMSPEQAGFNEFDVDTRSDVYSLGVLLYELLTGSPPFRRKDLEQAGVLEMLRLIREQEPPRPSTRLSTADGLPALAARRGTDPVKLARLVRGELDWIVMRALEKDRSRRYETASGFAADVQRYLADEPVQACPPSAGYRLRKLLRRHRGPVLAAAVVAVALVGGIVSATWGMLRATDAEAQTRDESLAKDEAHRRLLLEQENLSQEQRQAQINYATELLGRGLDLCERYEVDVGLLWLARALEAAPADAHDLQRVIRINLAAWSQQTSHLRACLALVDYNMFPVFSPDGRFVLTYQYSASRRRPAPASRLWETATGRLVGELNGWPAPGPALFTPDGRRLLLSDGQKAQMYDTDSVRPVGKALPLENVTSFFRYSPDSKVLLVKMGKELRRWDVETGQPLGEPVRVEAVGFTPDDTLVGAIVEGGKGVRFWDTATGLPTGKALELPEPATSLIVGPGWKTALVIGGKRGRLWDLASGKSVGGPLDHPAEIKHGAFTADGKTAATVAEPPGGSQEVWLWRVDTGALERTAPLFHREDKTHEVLFGGRQLFVHRPRYFEGQTHWVRWMDPSSDRARTPPRPRDVRTLAVTPAGALTLVEDTLNGVGQIWNATTGDPVGAPLPDPHAARAVEFSSDRRLYVPVENIQVTFLALPADRDPVLKGKSPMLRLWEVGSGRPHAQLQPMPAFGRGQSAGFGLAFSPDARLLLTGRNDGSLELIERTGASLGRAPTGIRSRDPFGMRNIVGVRAAALSPDGRVVLAAVVGQGREMALLWTAEAGKYVPRWTGEGVTVALSPDGKQFLEGGARERGKDEDRQTARLWDVARLTQLVPPLQHPAPVQVVAFSPDGKTLLTGCGDLDHPRRRAISASEGGEARLWDAATGKLRCEPLPHRGTVMAVAFSPDGKKCLTGSADGSARVWDAATGARLGSPLAHKGQVTAVAFSHDGRTVLTSSLDHTTRLWDVATGKPLGPPLHHLDWGETPTFLAFSPDDRSVLTAGPKDKLKRWDVVTAPADGDVERIGLWVQVLTGKELDHAGVLGQLDHKTWNERRQQLQKRGGTPLP